MFVVIVQVELVASLALPQKNKDVQEWVKGREKENKKGTDVRKKQKKQAPHFPPPVVVFAPGPLATLCVIQQDQQSENYETVVRSSKQSKSRTTKIYLSSKKRDEAAPPKYVLHSL